MMDTAGGRSSRKPLWRETEPNIRIDKWRTSFCRMHLSVGKPMFSDPLVRGIRDPR
jgi:hypothetical protein